MNGVTVTPTRRPGLSPSRGGPSFAPSSVNVGYATGAVDDVEDARRQVLAVERRFTRIRSGDFGAIRPGDGVRFHIDRDGVAMLMTPFSIALSSERLTLGHRPPGRPITAPLLCTYGAGRVADVERDRLRVEVSAVSFDLYRGPMELDGILESDAERLKRAVDRLSEYITASGKTVDEQPDPVVPPFRGVTISWSSAGVWASPVVGVYPDSISDVIMLSEVSEAG